ncbi:MAG: hypothetical protein ACFB00_11900 [Parvularculaceae bacterium]
MTSRTTNWRRALLNAGAAPLALIALAACRDGDATTPFQPAGPAPTPGTTPTPTPPPATGTAVTIDGVVTFDLVPAATSPVSLNYDVIQRAPSRSVVVEALDATGAVVASDITDVNGFYALTVTPNTDVQIRVRANMRSEDGATESFAVSVRDNTSNNAEYALIGALASSGADNSTRDLTALSGWDGTSYAGERAAGPFAVLDAIFETVAPIVAVDPDVDFPEMQVLWSPDNRPSDGDIADGDVTTSFFTSNGFALPTIVLLGAENVDTDEYDRHIVVHEFGHYIEDQLSRSDSTGGPHTLDIRLDPRLAFSEGFANALSGLILNDPVYRDTSGPGQANGFSFSVEDNAIAPGNVGWFSEGSTQSIVFDVGDAVDDGVDTLDGGIGLVYAALTSPAYSQGDAFTTIYAFADALRVVGAPDAAVDALLGGQAISGTGPFGEGETNNGGVPVVLPVYRTPIVGGAPEEVCNVDDGRTGVPASFGDFASLGLNAFARFTTPAAGAFTITAQRTSGASPVDPDFIIFNDGDVAAFGFDPVANVEQAPAQLPAGDFAAEIRTFNFSEDVCYDFSVQ